MDKEKTIRKISSVGIWGNVFLCAFKLFSGVIGHSGAMISDAVHSLSDVLATLIAWAGVKLAGRKEDIHHPYGHERFECVASLGLGLILAFSGICIGWSGLRSILTGAYLTAKMPTILPLIAAVVSIVCKEAMYHYTMHYAKILNSSAFVADAWHHRSDALSSIGSLAGILLTRFGFPLGDPLASVVICLFILKISYDILKKGLQNMVDSSCDEKTELALKNTITSVPGVLGIDVLHTRLFGSRIYADVEISVDRNLSLISAHEIAENVHGKLEKDFPLLKHVTVHVNPSTAEA